MPGSGGLLERFSDSERTGATPMNNAEPSGPEKVTSTTFSARTITGTFRRRLFWLIFSGPATNSPFSRTSALVTGNTLRPSPVTMVMTYGAPGWDATNPSP